jgi:predicted nucleic acid-binding protein
MNVVDSSAWLEYFAGGPNARHFAAAIEGTDELMVPTLVLLEVFKRIAQQRDDSTALQYVAVMKQGSVVDLDADLALAAAEVGLRHKLPLADSVVYATARRAGATVWTQDADFEGLDGVRFWAKRA